MRVKLAFVVLMGYLGVMLLVGALILLPACSLTPTPPPETSLKRWGERWLY